MLTLNLIRTAGLSMLILGISCIRLNQQLQPKSQSILSKKLVLKGKWGIHDPCLIKANGVYCEFSTGTGRTTADPGGIRIHISDNDLTGTWSTTGEIPVPDWARTKYAVTNLWAPELAYNESNRKYYLYYAASRFGTNQSGIGVASGTDPSDINNWTDHGEILSSIGQDYNAIDPNVFYDSVSGNWYMAWGSFFSGIRMQKMSSMTVLTGQIYTLAVRNVIHNPIEAASIVKRGRYYYLFVSWDFCCKGISSTYKTIVGRASDITGPYLDKNAVRMDQGGGTVLLQSDGNEIGPGGADVYQEGNNYYLVHHYYDGNQGGASKLSIRKLGWDTSGWPVP